MSAQDNPNGQQTNYFVVDDAITIARRDLQIIFGGLKTTNDTIGVPRFAQINIVGNCSGVRIDGVYINKLNLDASLGVINGVTIEHSVIKSATDYGIEAIGSYYIMNVTLRACTLIDYYTWAADKAFIFWNNATEGNGQIRLLDCAYYPYANGGVLKGTLLRNAGRIDSMLINALNPFINSATLTAALVHLCDDAQLRSLIVDNALFECKNDTTLLEIDDSSSDSGAMRCDVELHHCAVAQMPTKTLTLISNAVAHDAAWHANYYNRFDLNYCHGRDSLGTFALGTPGVSAHFLNSIKGCTGGLAALNN